MTSQTCVATHRPPLARGIIAALGLILCLALCQSAGARCPAAEPDGGLETYTFPPDMYVEDPIDSAEACPSWRWVAYKAAGELSCPEPESAPGLAWNSRPLFRDRGAGVPGFLQPFCLYYLEPGNPNAGDEEVRRQLNANLEQLVRRGRLLEVESGCAAVSPSAEMATESNHPFWRQIHDHFYAQAEELPEPRTPLRAGGHREHTCRPSVRLAVLDTQPHTLIGKPGHSNHGYALSQIIERLTCHRLAGAEHCAAYVAPRLALPIFRFDAESPVPTRFDRIDGGYFGTIDQLAEAVWEELEAWRGAGESHLVLNLSVGWIGERFGGLEETPRQMPLPVRALYRALEVASCRDALVIAASGNRVGGPAIERGPLLPGGWERRPAPSPSTCRKIDRSEGPREGPPRSEPESWEPLLYAAGGVHSDDSTLSNARPESEPPRVAFADHAVVRFPSRGGGGDTLRFLTGSSVATALVSATAATVWHQRPELDRHELMQLLHASGKDLGRQADIFRGPEAPSVRRIGLCTALRKACEKERACPEISSLRCPEPDDLVLDSGCASIDCGQAIGEIPVSALDATASFEDGCGIVDLHHDQAVGPPKYPCPFRQIFGIRARPWTGPQPQEDPCMGCSVSPPPDEGPGYFLPAMGTAAVEEDTGFFTDKSYHLYIEIDPRWDGSPEKPPLEWAIFFVGDQEFFLNFRDGGAREGLVGGDVFKTTGLSPSLFQPDESGDLPETKLHFYTAAGTIESPVLLAPGSN